METKSDLFQIATNRECNFTMGTILGKGFAQAQVLLTYLVLKKPLHKTISP